MNAFKQLYISYFAWIPQKAAVFKQASNKRFVKSYHYSWISRFEDTQTHDAVKPRVQELLQQCAKTIRHLRRWLYRGHAWLLNWIRFASGTWKLFIYSLGYGKFVQNVLEKSMMYIQIFLSFTLAFYTLMIYCGASIAKKRNAGPFQYVNVTASSIFAKWSHCDIFYL